MAKGITHSCANVWRAIARAGGWHSTSAISRDWDGVYSISEVLEHLATLHKGGFLEAGESKRDGDLWAYTAKCHPLPGEALLPVVPAAGDPEVQCSVAAPRVVDLMRTFYTPPQAIYRADAMDHTRCPSLEMGQRRAYRSPA